jgi:hypothetical protein
MYKNELTGEYTLAFRGSEPKDPRDWADDIIQGFSIKSPQYANAAIIGELLSGSKAKINIVGHSLGGGLATVAGLKTGFPTHTYNQADISVETVDLHHLDVSKSDNITAYYMDGEILTTLQNETRNINTLIPLGKKVKIGPTAPAFRTVFEMGERHDMRHAEDHFRNVYGESQVKWEGYNNVQVVLNNNNTYSNLLIDTK